MVGGALLVQPISEPGLTSLTVHLPGGSDSIWYDATSGDRARGGTSLTVPAPLSVTPRFQLGGLIIPRRERVRRSALKALADPLSLHIAPDATGKASGLLYLDDGLTPTDEPGRVAHLIRFDFSCDETLDGDGGGGGAGMAADTALAMKLTACELRATPQPWPSSASASASASAAMPHRIYVESILIRGVPQHATTTTNAGASHGSPSRAYRAVLEQRPPARGAAAQMALSTELSREGLHLTRMAAYLDGRWSIRITPRGA